MLYRHGFLHSSKTDQNELKHHYWVQKCGLGAFVSFLARIVSSFRFRPESVHSKQPGMVFCTVTKLTKTNQNITIGSKKVDWVRLFRFWRESVVRFGSELVQYILSRHGFLRSNETDKNEPKHHYWVQKSGLGAFLSFLARIGSSFRFRDKSVH